MKKGRKEGLKKERKKRKGDITIITTTTTNNTNTNTNTTNNNKYILKDTNINNDICRTYQQKYKKEATERNR